MKILIQDVKRGLYLTDDGLWTADANDARDFRYSSYAHAVMKREKTRGLRVLFYFKEFDYAIKVRKWTGKRFCQQLSAAAFDF